MSSIKEKQHLLKDTIYVIHGATVAENTLIERKGAKIGLITTTGQKYRLYLQRTNQFWPYDYNYHKAVPLVPKESIREVPERVEADGDVLVPLDEEAAIQAAKDLVGKGVEGIAVCFLNSWKNPTNEQKAAAAIKKEYSEIYVVTSSDVLPEILEYERFAATMITAYLTPITGRYVHRMETKLREKGLAGGFMIMQASGGVMRSEIAKAIGGASMIECGPAGGVVGATYLGEKIGYKNVIAFDMGGTTAKTCLIYEGVPSVSYENFKERFPVNLPMLGIVSIGAGGGSIAWIDDQGGMHVGPQSSGADPGPACYGKGNEEPTVTDAHVVLGRLAPELFLGGNMKIYPELAVRGVNRIAAYYDMDVEHAASGILDIVNSNMANLIRVVSVEKGYDPRDFVLMAYGGTGPMHAGRLARELNIPKIIIPPFPGIFSAYGMSVSDIKHDLVRGVVAPTTEVNVTRLSALFNEMEDEAGELLRKEGILLQNTRFSRLLDMRYFGQAYIPCTVEIAGDHISKETLKRAEETFHREHFRHYKWAAEGEKTEVINARVTAIGETPKPLLKTLLPSMQKKPHPFKRNVYFEDLKKWVECEFYDREDLPPKYSIGGPAVVYQLDSTTVIYPGQTATVDQYGNIMIAV